MSKKSISDIISGFKNYFGESIVVALFGIALIPILTRELSVEQYGILNVALSYISIATIVFTLNFHSAIARFFFEGTNDFKQFFGFCLLLSSSLFLVFSSLFIYFSEYNNSFNLAILSLTFLALVESVFRQIYQAELRARLVAVTGIGKAAMILLFTFLILSNVEHSDAVDALLSRILAGTVLALFLINKLYPYIGFGSSKYYVRYLISYSIPLIPYALSNIVLAHFDRIMIQQLIDDASVGLYSFAYNIGFMMSLVVGALNSSVYPVFFRSYNEKDYISHDNYVIKSQSVVYLAFFALLLFTEEIGVVLGTKEYQSSLGMVPIVVLSYVFYSFFSIYNRNFDYAKKTHISMIVMLLSALFNIGANYYFLPLYGFIAAAYTTLGSYIVLFVLSWLSSKYLIHIHSLSLWLLLKPFLFLTPLIILAMLCKGIALTWYWEFFVDLILLMLGFVLIFFSYLKQWGSK